MAKFIKVAFQAGSLTLIAATGLLLTACNGDVTTNNTVAGTTAASSFSTGAGTTVNVPMTFNTSTGSATQLSITNQASFPVGWSIPGATTCQTITNSGTTCQINFVYSPTEPIATSSFTVAYSYYSSGGSLQTGTETINYSATTNAPGFAYVTDSGGSLHSCTVSSSNGTFSNCATTPSSSAPWGVLNPPSGIAFASPTGSTAYAYVADHTTNVDGHVRQCQVNSNGTLSNCNDALPGGEVWVPNDLAISTVNGNDYAYVTSNLLGAGAVFLCSFSNTTGAFAHCGLQLAANSLEGVLPNAIAFGDSGGKTYAYIADSTNEKVFRCGLKSDASLDSCAVTPSSGAPLWTPNDVTTAIINGTTYGYVADNDGSIYQCTLNSNGTFNTCTATAPASPASWVPSSIHIRSVNDTTYAYVTATVGSFFHEVYQCTLNTNGTLNTCNATPSSGAPLWTPTNLGLN